MPTEKIPCTECGGSGKATHPREIEALRNRMENIRAAMAEDDGVKLQQYLHPKPPDWVLRGRVYQQTPGILGSAGRSHAKSKGAHAVRGLTAWVKELEAKQDPCEHCAGAGEIQHRTLAWEVIEGVVAVGPDGTESALSSRSWRCRVPGGWLVQMTESHNNGVGMGLTFVPDPDHTWVP